MRDFVHATRHVDPTRVRNGVHESFTVDVCAYSGEAESVSDDYNCSLVSGASSCVTTNCVSHGCCDSGC
jgi:hypothetical protein